MKSFWVIQNNQPVLEDLKRLNIRSKARNISTFDFSTLYTKIPHKKLLEVLNEITDFCFNAGTKEFISVTQSGARWVNKPSSKGVTFSKQTFKKAVRYVMNNCFFTLGNCIFRQVIGIPMGSDPAPFMANLFLYFYEAKYVNELKKSDMAKARKFRNTFRFIDDLLTVNDDGEFEKNISRIYPPELELKKEHSGDSVSFLDLQINLLDGKFRTSLFDKRDSFPFSIVRMPYKSSNIPSRIFYASLGAEILRIGRTTMTLECFVASSKCLIGRMIKQGGEKFVIIKVLKKLFGRHDVFLKFATNAKDFIHCLF